MTSEYLEEFEKLNTTTDSIYDLGDLNVLIILDDGTNLTKWDEVNDKRDIIYISEDLSAYTDLTGKYCYFTSLKGIVARGVCDKVSSMDRMFYGCDSLKDISSLKDWNVSNVETMKEMFLGCYDLVDLSPLKEWDVSNVTNMESMFNGCSSLVDLTPLKNWNVSNVKTVQWISAVSLMVLPTLP
jgi:surface protein